MSEEATALSWLSVALLVAAALVRSLAPVLDPTRATLHHAVAALLGALALTGWLVAAWPRIRRPRRALLRVEGKG